MRRRDFMGYTGGLAAILAAAAVPENLSGVTDSGEGALAALSITNSDKLTPPAKGKIPVAFAISQGVTVIDFAGPWEVFQDVMVSDRGQEMDEQMPFQLFTVADKIETLTGSGGLKLVPDYTFDSAPVPKIVVVPAQRGSDACTRGCAK